MTRVLALTKYADRAASTRQRLLQFIPALSAAGFEFEIRPLLDNNYLAALAKRSPRSLRPIASAYARRLFNLIEVAKYDIVFVHYEAFPYLPAVLESLVAQLTKRLIYDFDDATFHQYDQHQNSNVRRLLSNKLVPLLKKADACICGNAYLETYAKQFSDKTIIVPTVVDHNRYRVLAEPREDCKPVVGWMGSPSTYDQLKSVLNLLNGERERLGVHFRVIGSGFRSGPEPGVEYADWSEPTEAVDIEAMDIGIMPLVDEPWSRGKCGYKLIQYMACGLPVVASPVGVNTEIVEHGVNGFLAETESEWLNAVERLAKDPDLRGRMGLAGRAKVEAIYSLKVQAPRMVAVFTDVAARACAV